MKPSLASALEISDELRDLLDRERGSEQAEQDERIRAEAHRLEHLTCAAAREGTAYPALAAGLADFAHNTRKRLETAAEQDRST